MVHLRLCGQRTCDATGAPRDDDGTTTRATGARAIASASRRQTRLARARGGMYARARRAALRATTDIEPSELSRAFDFRCGWTGVARAMGRLTTRSIDGDGRRRYFNSLQSEMLEFW